MRRMSLCLMLLLLIALPCLAVQEQIPVYIESGKGFQVENNAQWIDPGEDAVFTVRMDRGVILSGTDYDGESQVETQDRTVTLTLKAVQYPTRVRLSVSSKYCAVVYDANGGVSLSGEAVIEKRCSVETHYRPNTENGQNLFVREGYTLTSWNTRSDGKGERIGLGSRVTPVNGSVRLYAQWSRWSEASLFDWEGTETVTVIGYHGREDVVVIPSFLDGKPVHVIACGAFAGCPAKEVVLPEQLKAIEDGAFRDCALTSLVLFDRIEQASDEAFVGCQNLQTLFINAAEAPFGYTYRKESLYADKVELLIRARGQRKLVFYGGCSMWFNLDSGMIARAFGDEFTIVNMGLNGTVSSAVQLQIMADFLEEGDILFHTPEMTSRPQLMITTGMGEYDRILWAGIENNYDLFTRVDLRTVDGVLDSFCHYLGLKNRSTDYQHTFLNDFDTPYIDSLGCIPFYRSGTKESLADNVTLNPALVSGGALDTLRAYYSWLTGMGVRILVSCAAVNMDAVPEEQRNNAEEVDRLFRESLSDLPGVQVVSRLKNYLYRNSDFYDTNYHLCSEPAKANTEKWIADLRQALDIKGAADDAE